MSLTKLRLPNGLINNDSISVVGAGSLFTTGTVVYVDSNTGSDGNRGTDPNFPKASVDGANNTCTANKGDKIVVMPNHAETVTSTSIALDVAGVSVICLGHGTTAATFTFSTAAATITVSAADVSWVGGYFVANYLDVASTFTIGAAKNFVLQSGEFEDGSSILNFLSVVTTGATNNAADGLTVIDNYYLGLNTTPLAFVSILANENKVTISRNFVDKASTADVGHFVTIAAKVQLGMRVQDNVLVVVGAAGATVGIFLTGSSTTNTGIVSGNLTSSLDTTTELMFTAGTGLKFFENYYTGVADKSGYLVPAADSAA